MYWYVTVIYNLNSIFEDGDFIESVSEDLDSSI